MYRGCGCNNNAKVQCNQWMMNQMQMQANMAEEVADDCMCGFDDRSVFPENYMYGQSYVPIQQLDKVFPAEVGLKMGTIFPELVSTYRPGQSMEEINYIRRMNEIGKGCNG